MAFAGRQAAPLSAMAALKVERADLARTVAWLRAERLDGLVPAVIRKSASRAVSELSGTNAAAADRSVAIMSRVTPRLAAVVMEDQPASDLASVRHFALRLLAGIVLIAIAGSAYATDMRRVAGHVRIWSIGCAVLGHIAMGGRRSPPPQRELITVLPGKEPELTDAG